MVGSLSGDHLVFDSQFLRAERLQQAARAAAAYGASSALMRARPA
jgi:hypothetical protein